MAKCIPTQYKGYTVCKGVEWDYDKKTLTVKMFPNSGKDYSLKGPYTWENKCPWCGKSGVLRPIGKKSGKTALEGEINCTACDADFDGVKGKDKKGRAKYLTKGSSTSKSAITNSLNTIKETKEEYDASKSAKSSMTLKLPPMKGIKDGYCHQLSSSLVSKDLIVFVESVELTEKEVVMGVNDKLEPPGEEYKPPSEASSGSGSTYNATTKAEKEIVAKGQELKKAADSATVEAIKQWIRKNINYVYYYNWIPPSSGDPSKLDKTTLGKRWDSKSGNCVFCAWLMYVMCQGAGVTVEIWNGNATFGSGKTYGHLWNKYKGKVYDGASSSSRNFRNAKKIK